MGKLTGTTPQWVSREDSGNNPLYPDQLSTGSKLIKDLDLELSVFDNWRKAEAGIFGNTNQDGELELTEGDLSAFKRIGRPCLVSISNWGTGSVEFVQSLPEGKKGVTGADVFTFWDTESKAVIKYYSGSGWGGHRKGLVKLESGASAKDGFIIPKVKTYVYTGSSSGAIGAGEGINFEEVYDSAEVNIRTGDITVRTDLKDKVYLVVIY